MTANIKYKTTMSGNPRDIDSPISDFVHARLSNAKLAMLIELLVVRGVLSRREVFDTFKSEEECLG